MILKSVRLQNFRYVKDSEIFKVDGSVTYLVGTNESGKTALLQALNKLNPVIEEDEDFQDLDYPFMEWTEYKARKDSDPHLGARARRHQYAARNIRVVDRLHGRGRGVQRLLQRSDVVGASRQRGSSNS